MKYIVVLLFTLASTYGNSQTVVIAKRTKKAIYVSADSRVGIFKTDSAGKSIRDTSTMCKMWTDGKNSFATTGFLIFDNVAEAKKACGRAKTLPAIIKTFVDSFAQFIADRMEIYRKFIPETYNSGVLGHVPLATTIFFGVESDTLFSMQVKFNLINKATEPCIVQWSFSYLDILYGGLTSDIKASLNYKGTWEKEKDIPNRMIELTNIEAELHPMIVSTPIDILKVTKKRVRWLQRKKLCD